MALDLCWNVLCARFNDLETLSVSLVAISRSLICHMTVKRRIS